MHDQKEDWESLEKNKEKKILRVSLIGKPNSGKSSLVNGLVNKKISAVSSKPNTTINLVRGVFIDEKKGIQIVFIDTPGISYKIGTTEKNQRAKSTINQSDLSVFVFPGDQFLDRHLLDFSSKVSKDKKLALITKIDKVAKVKLLPFTKKLNECGFEHIEYVSNKTKDGFNQLKELFYKFAKSGEWDFSPGEFTDLTPEELMKEGTREVLFNKLYKELPYEIEIINKEISLNENNEFIIHQYLNLKKNAHHILLGRIKEISMECAKNISLYLGQKKIHLYLHLIDKNQKRKR